MALNGSDNAGAPMDALGVLKTNQSIATDRPTESPIDVTIMTIETKPGRRVVNDAVIGSPPQSTARPSALTGRTTSSAVATKAARRRSRSTSSRAAAPRRHRPLLGVEAGAVEAPVDDALDASAQRLEEGRDDEGRGRNSDRIAAGQRIEDGLQASTPPMNTRTNVIVTTA